MRKIPVGSLEIAEEDKTLIRKILDSNQLSPGKYSKQFEKEFAKRHGADYGIFVNSGTDALRIALAAMKEKYGWRDGDYVAVPAITFVATANIVIQNNLKPLFIDVNMGDFNINPDWLDRKLETSSMENVRAVIPVHLFGKPCEAWRVKEVARKYNLKILEDSCETMGVNNLEGDVACFSTYVCHLISTGVGGLAITNDEELNDLMRSYANHGRDIFYIPGYVENRYGKELVGKRFKFDRIGYSSRLTELEAALGLGQLKRLGAMINERQVLARELITGLSYFSEFVLPEISKTHAYMMLPVVLKEDSRFKRDELCEHLEKNGIETRPLMPLINQPCYKSLGIHEDDFYVAKWINRCGFYIGCHPGMSEKDVKYILKTFRSFFDGKSRKAKIRKAERKAEAPDRISAAPRVAEKPDREAVFA